MTLRHITTFVVTAIAVAFVIAWLRTGYLRRRTFWARDSWWRFAGVAGAGLALLLLPVGVEVAVARGLLSRNGLSQVGRSSWALGAIALMVVGACIFVATLNWFAVGEPQRPFPGAARRQVHSGSNR